MRLFVRPAQIQIRFRLAKDGVSKGDCHGQWAARPVPEQPADRAAMEFDNPSTDLHSSPGHQPEKTDGQAEKRVGQGPEDLEDQEDRTHGRELAG